MNRGARDNHDHPDNAPGRIPESLIHAALDGEVSDDMRSEIADALKYDKTRKQELFDTVDAIEALRSDVQMPDFSTAVLGELDRQQRFIPASWQRLVRNGRMGVAAALLLTLFCVAGLQRIYPRLATIGHQETPVRDIASAVESETSQVQEQIREQVRTVRASMLPQPIATVSTPGRTNFSFALDLNDVQGQTVSSSASLKLIALPTGYLLYLPNSDEGVMLHAEQTAVITTASWSRGWSMSNLRSAEPRELLVGSTSRRSQDEEPLELP
jgi:hypothetical protein